MEFHKYHGLGNDFIMVDALTDYKKVINYLTPEKITAACRHKYGIGADGIILLKSSENADFGMRLFNSDGSEAELSGNGLRCLALFIKDLGLNSSDKFDIETGGGITSAEILSDRLVSVWMPVPAFTPQDIPFDGSKECIDSERDFNGHTFKITALSIGNPHCVIFEPKDVSEAKKFGPIIENSPLFPERTNVEFVEIKSVDRIRAIVFERGAGITEACGSGSCASVIAGIKTGRLKFDTPVTVEVLGGELIVTVRDDYSEVILTGEAEKVFEGNTDE